MGTQKIWTVPDPGYAHAPFSPKFLMGFVRMDPIIVLAKFDVRSFSRSRDNSDCRLELWVGLQTPIFGKRRP